jgi:GNAT superfamily N-acetyltransferase
VQLTIRPCVEADFQALTAVSSSVELSVHRERLLEQERGECTYLVAWAGDELAGHMKIRWSGSVHAIVRECFPAVPEFRRLRVNPDMQGMGIGGKMLEVAELMVARQGFYFSGLCVALANTGAQRLYARNGYEDWGQGVFESRWKEQLDDGSLVEKHHEVTYMLKPLSLNHHLPLLA